MFIEKTVAAIIIGFCLGGIVNVAVDVAIPDAPPPIPERTFTIIERKLAHTTESEADEVHYEIHPRTKSGLMLEEMNEVLDAIAIVESAGDPNAIGDNGNAIGLFQIWESYWTDGIERSGIGGEYSDCFDPTYARMVVLGYMDRYATPDRLGRAVTQKDIAFLHNGGPRAIWAKGQKLNNLETYWSKVRRTMQLRRNLAAAKRE